MPDTDLRSLPDPDVLPLAEGIRRAKAGSSKTPQRAGEENSKLKRLVGAVSGEQVLKDIAEGNFQAPSGVVGRSSMRVRSMESANGARAGWSISGMPCNATSPCIVEAFTVAAAAR